MCCFLHGKTNPTTFYWITFQSLYFLTSSFILHNQHLYFLTFTCFFLHRYLYFYLKLVLKPLQSVIKLIAKRLPKVSTLSVCDFPPSSQVKEVRLSALIVSNNRFKASKECDAFLTPSMTLVGMPRHHLQDAWEERHRENHLKESQEINTDSRNSSGTMQTNKEKQTKKSGSAGVDWLWQLSKRTELI